MEENENIVKKLLFRYINKETVSYLIFGVITTLINIASYKLCVLTGIVYTVSTCIAWLIAVIFAFVTNKLYVFESKNMQPCVVFKEAVSFIAARLFSGAFDLGFMILAVEIIHMDDFIAKIMSNFIVVVINYVLSKLFVFKKNKDQN